MNYDDAITLIKQAARVNPLEVEPFRRFSGLAQAAVRAFDSGNHALALRLKNRALLLRLELGVCDGLGVAEAIEAKLESIHFESQADLDALPRDVLETRVKACCPPNLWYCLQDTLEETPDGDLIRLIRCYE
jgi:hypothetical protein